jgi:hypothetical protein
MKKIKHYYSSYMQQYEAGDEALLTKSDLLEWYSKTGVKLHTEMQPDQYSNSDTTQVAYTWEFVEEEKVPRWFFYVGSEEVDINQDTVSVESSKSKPVNWQPNWKGLDYKRQVPKRRV